MLKATLNRQQHKLLFGKSPERSRILFVDCAMTFDMPSNSALFVTLWLKKIIGLPRPKSAFQQFHIF